MSDLAIQIEGLGKRYRLGTREPYKTLRDSLTSAVTTPFRMLSNLCFEKSAQPSDNFIWALKDISLQIKHGEVVGIIGRNGAGKSTLLKILSRITEPTEGYAKVRGRVGSLLEIGTGFHPELTGRENIYLSGAILGMKKREIERRFDEIVGFAEIEKFLDTPVKHYSSGMYVRLAFAVAAHLEPDILLVDEVLAVGDAAFQKKCLGRMGDVAKEGRTVLFVSHNMPSVAMLCDRVILLSAGRLIADGPATKIVNSYLSGMSSSSQQRWDDLQSAPGTNLLRLRSVRTCDAQGNERSSFGLDDDILIEITYWILKPGIQTHVGYHLFNAQGVLVFVANDFHDREWLDLPKEAGIYRSVCRIPGAFLNEGTYTFHVAIALAETMRAEIFLRDAAAFDLIDDGTSEVRGRFSGPWSFGVLRPKLEWKTVRLSGI